VYVHVFMRRLVRVVRYRNCAKLGGTLACRKRLAGSGEQTWKIKCGAKPKLGMIPNNELIDSLSSKIEGAMELESHFVIDFIDNPMVDAILPHATFTRHIEAFSNIKR